MATHISLSDKDWELLPLYLERKNISTVICRCRDIVCTIVDIQYENGALSFLYNVVVGYVKITGMVVGVQHKEHASVLFVDDGTHVLRCTTSEICPSYDELRQSRQSWIGKTVTVTGKRQYLHFGHHLDAEGPREIQVAVVECVLEDDDNAETMHIIQCERLKRTVYTEPFSISRAMSAHLSRKRRRLDDTSSSLVLDSSSNVEGVSMADASSSNGSFMLFPSPKRCPHTLHRDAPWRDTSTSFGNTSARLPETSYSDTTLCNQSAPSMIDLQERTKLKDPAKLSDRLLTRTLFKAYVFAFFQRHAGSKYTPSAIDAYASGPTKDRSLHLMANRLIKKELAQKSIKVDSPKRFTNSPNKNAKHSHKRSSENTLMTNYMPSASKTTHYKIGTQKQCLKEPLKLKAAAQSPSLTQEQVDRQCLLAFSAACKDLVRQGVVVEASAEPEEIRINVVSQICDWDKPEISPASRLFRKENRYDQTSLSEPSYMLFSASLLYPTILEIIQSHCQHNPGTASGPSTTTLAREIKEHTRFRFIPDQAVLDALSNLAHSCVLKTEQKPGSAKTRWLIA